MMDDVVEESEEGAEEGAENGADDISEGLKYWSKVRKRSTSVSVTFFNW